MKARVRVARDSRGVDGGRGVARGGCFGRDLPIRDTSESSYLLAPTSAMTKSVLNA